MGFAGGLIGVHLASESKAPFEYKAAAVEPVQVVSADETVTETKGEPHPEDAITEQLLNPTGEHRCGVRVAAPNKITAAPDPGRPETWGQAYVICDGNRMTVTSDFSAGTRNVYDPWATGGLMSLESTKPDYEVVMRQVNGTPCKTVQGPEGEDGTCEPVEG